MPNHVIDHETVAFFVEPSHTSFSLAPCEYYIYIYIYSITSDMLDLNTTITHWTHLRLSSLLKGAGPVDTVPRFGPTSRGHHGGPLLRHPQDEGTARLSRFLWGQIRRRGQVRDGMALLLETYGGMQRSGVRLLMGDVYPFWAPEMLSRNIMWGRG